MGAKIKTEIETDKFGVVKRGNRKNIFSRFVFSINQARNILSPGISESLPFQTGQV